MTKPAKSDKGAVATASRLEEHEREAERLFSELTAKIPQLWADYNAADGNEAEQKRIAGQIESIQKQADTQFKRWMDLSKQVREFYKSVAEEKRDGEKVSRIDAEEFFKQFRISLKMGIESYVISLSQDACRVDSPEAFYQAHADNLRACLAAALGEAERDGKLPNWAIE